MFCENPTVGFQTLVNLPHNPPSLVPSSDITKLHPRSTLPKMLIGQAAGTQSGRSIFLYRRRVGYPTNYQPPRELICGADQPYRVRAQ